MAKGNESAWRWYHGGDLQLKSLTKLPSGVPEMPNLSADLATGSFAQGHRTDGLAFETNAL